jgi:SAM-dependent methyltransferase
VKIGLPLQQAIMGWDIATWGQCLDFWRSFELSLTDKQILELGAHQGGLSLYFALQGAQVICSDLSSPEARAQPFHLRYGQDSIGYQALNALDIALPDCSQDVVVFKSVLGGIRRGSEQDPKPIVMAEIERVLRPGGWLFFAENLVGSQLHMFLRKRFVAWASYWDYLTLSDLPLLLSPFAEWHYQTAGFLALCGRTERQRQKIASLDSFIGKYLSKNQNYCVFVAARKGL